MREKKLLVKATRVANIILGGAGVICLLALFYFIYHYSLTGERQFTSPVGMIVYYVVPALLAGLSLTSLRLGHSHKINLSLFVVTSGISIYALELFLTPPNMSDEDKLAAYTKERQKLAKQFGSTVDTRSRLEVINDFRRQGIEAYPALYPRVLLKKEADGSLKSMITIGGAEVLPLGGISSKVTVLCNENGDYAIYEADEHGFNNPKGLWNDGHVDIAAVGDSFTHGYCVSPDKNFVALIRKRYAATLNLGAAANGPLLMLATIKEYVRHIEPKIVLWFYYEGNDLEDLMQSRGSPLLMRYMEADFDQGLPSRQSAIDVALVTHVKEVKRAPELANRSRVSELGAMMRLKHLRQGLGLIYGRSQEDIDTVNERAKSKDRTGSREPDLNLFRNILVEAREIVSRWGGKLCFIYLPEWQRYTTSGTGNKDRDRVLVLVREIGVPVIDIHKAFMAHGDPLALFPFRQYGHYNEGGNRLVAEEALRFISAR